MSALPPDLLHACDRDAEGKGRCLCGNCSNDAITNVCLRYTQTRDDKGWVLAGCVPGTDCEKTAFPSGLARKKDDRVVSCPCKGHAPLVPKPKPPPAPPCQPPFSPPKGFWGHLAAVSGRVVFWIGVASLVMLIYMAVKRLRSWHSHSKASSALGFDVAQMPPASSFDLPPPLPPPPPPLPMTPPYDS